MQFVQLINHIDICSNVFLRFLDSIDHLHLVDNKFVVDFMSSQNRMLIVRLFEEEIRKTKSFGKINIYINTCRVSQNWRNETNKPYQKYDLTDMSITVNPNKMEFIFDKAWEMITNTQSNVFQYKELDSMDTIKIMEHFIGSNFISQYQPEYGLIQDGNKIINRSLKTQIPDYLYTEVETSLRHKQIT